jgi:succinate dehydrogenase / fumarate reductase cytochrome b subunit
MVTLGVGHFYLRRLHSLSGVFPIGIFLLEHFFGNGLATREPEA